MAKYRQIFSNEDTDDLQLTALQKIIIGIYGRDIQTYLTICSLAEINAADNNGETALHWAVRRGDYDVVKLLLIKGADPNISSKTSLRALHYAAMRGDSRVMDCLLSYGAEVDTPDVNGRTPLLYMFTNYREPNPACLHLLIKAGAKVNATDYQGVTSLIFASQHGRTTALKILLQSHADVNQQTNSGENALMIAVTLNQHSSLRVLLSHNAKHTLYSETGHSILHKAAEYGDIETLQILASLPIKGLQVSQKDTCGNTPLLLAQQRTDEISEWHIAFATLLASVDKRTSGPQSIEVQTNINIFRRMAIEIGGMIMVWLWDEVVQISEYVSQLPRPPGAILRAFVVVCIAIVWFVMHGS